MTHEYSVAGCAKCERRKMDIEERKKLNEEAKAKRKRFAEMAEAKKREKVSHRRIRGRIRVTIL